MRTAWWSSIALPLSNTIPLSYRDKILRIPGVKAITHNNWFGGIYQDEKNFFPQFVIDPQAQREVFLSSSFPMINGPLFLKDRQGAVVGARTAERFHWKIGDRIPIKTTLYGGGSGNSTLSAFTMASAPKMTKPNSGFSGIILKKRCRSPSRVRLDGMFCG